MKRFSLIVLLMIFSVFGLMAQDSWPDLNLYSDIIIRDIYNFGSDWKSKELSYQNNELGKQIAALEGKPGFIDTPLEGALGGYYITPDELMTSNAEAILPRSNPRLVDRQLGAYVYKNLIIYRFLADTAAVSCHEAILQWIIGRSNVTNAGDRSILP